LKSVDHNEPTSHFLHFNLIGASAAVNLACENIWIALVSEIDIIGINIFSREE